MKQMKLLLLFLCAYILNCQYVKADSIEYTVHYDPNKLTSNFNNAPVIIYDDLTIYQSVSGVSVPVDNIFFSVPYNATNFSVEFNALRYINYLINRNGALEQLSIEGDSSSLMISDSIITHSFAPSDQCEIIKNGYMFGDNQLVTLKFLPILYNQNVNAIRLIVEGTIKIKYDIDNNIIPSVVRYDIDTKLIDVATIKPLVKNGDSIMSNSFVFGNIINETLQSSIPTYSYCILTSRALKPAFKKIIAMKRQKGLSAGIICIEDLMESSDFNSGDIQEGEYPIVTDTAGIVRNYLKYAFQSSANPTRYLLLGGKAPYAPVRYAHTNALSDLEESHVSTDLYFSDLTLNWIHYPSGYDATNESEYLIAESSSKNCIIPYYPEINIGRLLCSTTEEIDNYSTKLYRYVFNPGNGNSSYLSEALITTSGHLFSNSSVSRIANSIFDNHYHYLNNSQEQFTGSQFIDYINNNLSGYLSINAHGEPQSITILDGSVQTVKGLVTGIDSNPVKNWCLDENGNGLDCLLNKYKPFIFYTVACTTMPYDRALNIDASTIRENKLYFGESFTLGKNYGGPAFLGNTRSSLKQSCNLESFFLQTVFKRNIYSLGTAEAISKFYYNDDTYKTEYNHTILTHNLLGDPEFEMWTSEPQRYTDITVNKYDNCFIINGITTTDTISYCDNDGNFGKKYGSYGFDILNGVSPTTSVMIYNHDHIPYIVSLNLQNCNINNSQYVYASSFSAGKAVLPNNTPGNVTIKNGAVYEVEATDDVCLGDGFVVESGATFAIKTPGKVTIDGCVFQSGARVKIEAGKVEIVKNFTAELGSAVEINKYTD